MFFVLHMVHTPEAVPAHDWRALQEYTRADEDHALPFCLEGAAAHEVTGTALDAAVRETLTPHLGAERAQSLTLSTGGHSLRVLPLGSPELFPGMVVLLSESGQPVLRPEPPALHLRVNRGPDSGRLIPLSRGKHQLGRGACDIQLSDAAVSRDHAELDVGRVRFFCAVTPMSRQHPSTPGKR